MVDGTRPTLVTTGGGAPRTSSDGSKILLTFSEEISAADLTKFTVMSGMNTLSTTGTAAINLGNQTKVEISLASALTDSDTAVTVALDAGAVSDKADNDINAVSATAVILERVPGAPVLTAAARDQSIALSWTIAVKGSSDIIRFEYRIKETVSGSYPATWTDTGAAASNTGGTATIENLVNGTDYTVQVRAVNSNGEGANSNEPTATPGEPPSAPRNLRAKGSSTSQIDLLWDAPRSAEDAAVVTGYKIEVSTDSGVNWSDLVADTMSTTRSYSHTGLSSGDTRHYRVSAISDVGTGPESNVASGSAMATAPAARFVEFTSDPGDDETYARYFTLLVTPDVVEATVIFDGAVDVTGTPQLELDFDGTPKAANCAAHGTDTTRLVCSYTVAENDSAPNGIAIEANKLTLNGGTIRQSGSTTVNAVLTHGAVAIDSGHKVDGIRPTLVTTGDDAPKTSEDGTQVVLTFSEDVVAAGASDFVLTVNSLPGYQFGATVTVSGRTVTLTLIPVFTIQHGQTATLTLQVGGVRDTAGNRNAATSTQTVVTNNVPAPAAAITGVEITSDPGMDGNYETGNVIQVTATFDNAVTVTGNPRILLRLETGTSFNRWAEYASGSGTTEIVFAYTVLSTDESDTDGIAVGRSGLTNTVDLNGGTVTEPVTGEQASLSYTALDSDSGHRVNWALPTLSSAATSTDGTKVLLTFSEPVRSPPATSHFTVKVDDTAVTLSGPTAAHSGKVVTLTLTTALTSATQVVTVSYTKPTTVHVATPVQDEAGNLANSFTDQAVTNKFDAVKPTLSSANASSDLTKIVLTFSEALLETPLPATGDFTLTVDSGTAPTIDSVAIDGRDVTLSLSAAVDTSKTYTIAYTAGTNPIKDLVGNAAEDFSGQSVSLVDTTAPTFVSAGTSGTDQVVLTYDEALNTTQPATSAFTVKVGGTDRGVDTVAISGSAVTLTLASAFRPGDELTVAYAKPATNPIKDAADNEALSLAETTVTNNLAATAPEAPSSLLLADVAVPPGPPVTVNEYADRLALNWSTPWHNGSDITKFQYRYAEGTSVPATTGWTDIPDSAPTEQNANRYVVEGLDPGTEYTFELRAVNGIGGGGEKAAGNTTPAPDWRVTLRDSSNNNVTELTEGGDAATATVSITNNVRFGADQTVELRWGVLHLTAGLIQGAGGVSTITILSGEASGTLEISSPQKSVDSYDPPSTQALIAYLGENLLGNSIQLTRVDDEPAPVATITQAPDSVNEGDGIEVEISLNPPFGSSVALAGRLVNYNVTDDDGALSSSLSPVLFQPEETSKTVTLTAAENTTQNDGARTVTFALELNDDSPYTLGTAPAVTSVTITVRDDDTPPLAPRNFTAQAGNTEAILSWDAPLAPSPDHGQPVLRYEYRVKVGTGSFSAWAPIPGGDADTRSHTFTGLTNDELHTYELAAVNVAERGAVVQETVTPIEGVEVSFGAASLSVDENDSVTVTVTLATAPAVGETVTVPIVATRGTGLDSSEYSGVPSSVVFNAGDTSKSFTVSATHDTDDEPDAVLTLGFDTLPEGYVPGTHATLTITIVDDDYPIVSATFDAATAKVQEGTSRQVTVSLSQAPEREVVVPIRASRGANLAADEVSGVPADVTFAADETAQTFTVAIADDAVEEGNETLTLSFPTTLPERVNSAGANPQLVLTVTDDDGPPLAADVSVQTGDGFAVVSWPAVQNDSPVLHYEVRWRESDGGAFNAWQQVGLVTSYRVEGLDNDKAYEFQVRGVNAHGNGEEASASGTPTERITGIPKAVQVLQVKATDSARAELSWTRPSNGTDRVTATGDGFAQIQGYRIEVCRTSCGDADNWYALVANTGRFAHKYTHQVLAPGVIRENRYRVRAININGKTGPWSNVATLEATKLERFWLVAPSSSTVNVRLEVWHPDGNPLYVRYTGGGEVRFAEKRLTKRGYETIALPVEASTHYRVEVDFVDTFDSPRRQTATVWSLQEGADPYTSPYAADLVEAQVWQGGTWRDASDTALSIRMGETGKYRMRLKPCTRIYTVTSMRIESPAGRLGASPTDIEPARFGNLNCKVEQDGWRTDEDGNFVTLGQIYDMTAPHLQDRANDRIPVHAGTPNVWREVTVSALALEDYARDRRADALLSAPFAVVYNHRVSYGSDDTRSGLVSEGTGLVRILVDRPADAELPVPSGVTIGSDRVMSWDAVPGASHYLVEWRHGPRYSNRANTDRSHVSATSKTLPAGASGRGPVTARVRAYSTSGVSGWSAERTWDSRPPTLNVVDTAVNEDDGSVGFLVTLAPASTGTVTVDYATHEAAGLTDRGIAGTFAWTPRASGRGPSLSVSQTFGAGASSGKDGLLARETLEGLAANDIPPTSIGDTCKPKGARP